MTKFGQDQNNTGTTGMRAKIRVQPVFLVRPKHVIIHNFVATLPVYMIVGALESAESAPKLGLLRLF